METFEDIVASAEGLIRRYTVLNKGNQKEQKILDFGEIQLDTYSHKFKIKGVEVLLTSNEYKLLQLMLSSQGKTFTFQHLFIKIREEEYMSDSKNSVECLVRRLNNKLKKYGCDAIIKNVRGTGYRLS